MLVTMKEILLDARKEHRAIGAFNVANYETAVAVLQAAEAEKSPVIIQVFKRLFDSEKGADIGGMLLRLAHRSTVPVALHLDHGSEVRQVKIALSAGYTSVMLDASNQPFDKNVEMTAWAVNYAHALGASAEGEIGHVAMGDETALTTVDEAVKFAALTGVDALAVSIGTCHGYYKTEPCIDVKRAVAIANALPDLPLVLHGGSGTPLDKVHAVIKTGGISKVNIATEYMDTYLKSTRRNLEALAGKFIPVDKFMDPVIADCMAHVQRLIKFFRD